MYSMKHGYSLFRLAQELQESQQSYKEEKKYINLILISPINHAPMFPIGHCYKVTNMQTFLIN